VIGPRLEELRRRLLDLTRRNRLLNFRLARRSSIALTGVTVDEAFRLLVEEPAADTRRVFSSTGLDAETLEAKLTYLAREARSALEEQGTCVLHVALGLVRWREGPDGTECEAPLVLVPVELSRRNVQSAYALAAFDDEPVVNPCLVELARRQFGVEWPAFDAEAGPGAYFERVGEVLARELVGWSLAREAHLGLFRFAKMLMWRDLSDEPAFAGHPLVRRFCGEPLGLPDEATPMPDPRLLDRMVAPSESFSVLDADASQTAAILAAKLGKTLVIEGPPGTGKSQTIANIIAECMAAGRTVLFVAEKAAALEVVKRRLDAVGLGDFALELHSRHAKRRAVMDELRRSLERTEGGEVWTERAAEDLATLRARLNEHVREMHAPVGPMEVSAFAAVARAAALADAPEAACGIAEVHAWSRAELAAAVEAVERLDAAAARVGDTSAHPWRGTRVTRAGVEVRQAAAAGGRAVADALAAHRAEALRLAETLGGDDAASGPAHATRIAAGVLAWLEHGDERERQRAIWSRAFVPEAEGERWEAVFLRRRQQRTSLVHLLIPSWHADGERIGRWLRPGVEPSDVEIMHGLAALVEGARWRAGEEQARRALSIASEVGPEALAALCGTLVTSPTGWLGADAGSFEALAARLGEVEGAEARLDDWAAYAAAREACGARLAEFVRWTETRATGTWARAFERQFWRLFADRALAASVSLREFRGEDHSKLIERFRQADVEWIRASRRRLLAAMGRRRPGAGAAAQLGVLKAQMKRKRGGASLRTLFAATGDAVLAVKPCFMMSPISVAQYLEPGGVSFDVVIFDEASQVEPADAFGALARARQALFVGDDRQLPPTSFFERGDDESEDLEVAVADLESILDVARHALPEASVCSLAWHYRSRHQSLIAFSNARFYDGRLKVFPSPHADTRELGLALRHVPDGVYGRGEGQTNPVEARAVARAVLAHAGATPEVSLGVGAFSLAQQRAIEDELERARREVADERLERFFDPARPEPFFVKNLETIQGDEREVVFLSVGYGRDRAGRLTMNFGPLNREGGWRRLNVLVTRARRRCEVFTSVRHEDLVVGADGAPGLAALKEYLRVAEHGALDGEAAGGAGGRLEDAIARALVARGWAVHVRVGAAGSSVDVAVVDPDRPGRYLLGIECDGETYSGTPTARDRDRLRAEVLAGLGWNVTRVWAADWLKRPQAVLDGLLERLEELRRTSSENN
jgi:hypothetical protein